MTVHDDGTRLRAVERHRQTDDGALARAAGPHQRRRSPCRRLERDSLEHRHAFLVLEPHVLERNVAANSGKPWLVTIFLILGGHRSDFPYAVEPGERFGDLRSDGRDLNQRRHHDTGQHEVQDKITDGHHTRQHGSAPHQNHDDTDAADDQCGKSGEAGHASDGLCDVPEQLVHALGENQFFPPLSRIRLDDAHARQGLIQAPGDLRIDLASLDENGTQPREGKRHHARKRQENDQREHRQAPVESEEPGEGDRGSDQATRQLDQSRSDEISDAVGIGHDARNQHARLGGVEVRHRQASHVLLHGLPHVRDRSLGRDAEDLGEGKGRTRLHERRHQRDGSENREKLGPGPSGDRAQEARLIADHIVDQHLGQVGHNQPGGPVDQHHGHAQHQTLAVGIDQLLGLAPSVADVDALLLVVFGQSASSVSAAKTASGNHTHRKECNREDKGPWKRPPERAR